MKPKKAMLAKRATPHGEQLLTSEELAAITASERKARELADTANVKVRARVCESRECPLTSLCYQNFVCIL